MSFHRVCIDPHTAHGSVRWSLLCHRHRHHHLTISFFSFSAGARPRLQAAIMITDDRWTLLQWCHSRLSLYHTETVSVGHHSQSMTFEVDSAQWTRHSSWLPIFFWICYIKYGKMLQIIWCGEICNVTVERILFATPKRFQMFFEIISILLNIWISM